MEKNEKWASVLGKSCNRDQGLTKVCEGSESIHVNSTTKCITSALSPWFSWETTNIKGHKTFFFFPFRGFVQNSRPLENIFVSLLCLIFSWFVSISLFSTSPSFCPAVRYHILSHSTCVCEGGSVHMHVVAFFSLKFRNCTHILLLVMCPLWLKMALPSFPTFLIHCPSLQSTVNFKEKSVLISKIEDVTSLRKCERMWLTFWRQSSKKSCKVTLSNDNSNDNNTEVIFLSH